MKSRRRAFANSSGTLLIVQNCLFLPLGLLHSFQMKLRELSPKQLASVRSPVCGVRAGKGCVLHSGTARSWPQVDLKFAAVKIAALMRRHDEVSQRRKQSRTYHGAARAEQADSATIVPALC